MYQSPPGREGEGGAQRRQDADEAGGARGGGRAGFGRGGAGGGAGGGGGGGGGGGVGGRRGRRDRELIAGAHALEEGHEARDHALIVAADALAPAERGATVLPQNARAGQKGIVVVGAAAREAVTAADAVELALIRTVIRLPVTLWAS